MTTYVKFARELGAMQELPDAYKPVLCLVENESFPSHEIFVVGYLKYCSGDIDSPMFVTPGAAVYEKVRDTLSILGKVVGWCDCLSKSFISSYFTYASYITSGFKGRKQRRILKDAHTGESCRSNAGTDE